MKNLKATRLSKNNVLGTPIQQSHWKELLYIVNVKEY